MTPSITSLCMVAVILSVEFFIVMLSIIIPSVILLRVKCLCAENHNAEFRYAKCLCAERHNADCLYAEGLYAECLYAECLYAECLYAECLYAECLYAECLYAVSLC